LLRKKKNRKKRKLSWDEKLWMCNVHYIWYWNWFKIFKSSSKKKTSFYTCRLIRSVKVTWRILQRYG
jgi:hypothetical protein